MARVFQQTQQEQNHGGKKPGAPTRYSAYPFVSSVMDGGHDWQDGLGVQPNHHKCGIRAEGQFSQAHQQGIHSFMGMAAHATSFPLADTSSLIQIFLYLFWGNLPFPSSYTS